jgi:NTP pyrophosphatase (non-canonical NTP hydrolase)
MTWLAEYAASAEKADRFRGRSNHAQLLGAGLMGEAGSVLSELKKEERELNAYPVYRHRMQEELGDLLWYFIRLVAVAAPSTLEKFAAEPNGPSEASGALPLFLELGSVAGDLAGLVASSPSPEAFSTAAERMWILIQQVAAGRKLVLSDVAAQNLKKIKSRWPDAREYAPLFDRTGYDEEECLPRTLEIEFRERGNAVILRCNGLNFGDRVTDNIKDRDGYRFHDVFHFAYAVHLGWSPVLRALFRCKRKSKVEIDEGQDGARATIVEEAVSAFVFSRAKQLSFFDEIDRIDYDLLKVVSEHVQGYEVDQIPLWQWEVAILDGFRIFRKLVGNHGGTVRLDLNRRQLEYHAPLRS